MNELARFEVKKCAVLIDIYPSARSHGRYSIANREFHQSRQIYDSELRHDPAAVGFDALRGDADERGRLRDGLAFHRVAQHLLLARAERAEQAKLARTGFLAVEAILTDRVAEIAASRVHGADR